MSRARRATSAYCSSTPSERTTGPCRSDAIGTRQVSCSSKKAAPDGSPGDTNEARIVAATARFTASLRAPLSPSSRASVTTVVTQDDPSEDGSCIMSEARTQATNRRARTPVRVQGAAGCQTVLHGFPAMPVQAVQSLAFAGNLPGSGQSALPCCPADRHVVALSAMIVPFSKYTA